MRISVIVAASVLGTLCAVNTVKAEARYADTQLLVGRYSAHLASPAFDQLNPLAQIVTVKFSPKRVRTVGQALQQLLLGSGYAQIHGPDEFAAALLSKPLPAVHRQLGPLPLASALKTLIGQPYEIMVNEVRREVCVELKKSIQPDAMTPLAQAIRRSTRAPSLILENTTPSMTISALSDFSSPSLIHRGKSSHAHY